MYDVQVLSETAEFNCYNKNETKSLTL